MTQRHDLSPSASLMLSAPRPGPARRISQRCMTIIPTDTDIRARPNSRPRRRVWRRLKRPEIVELSDGDEFELRIAPVTKEIGGNSVRMLAYNGSIPGPTLKVRQGSEILVHAVNEGDLEATVHWHGLRLDNEYDGTHQTQAPMAVGESFTYQLRFPGRGPVLVPPAHPPGLRPGDGPLRQHPRRAE